MRIAFHAPLKPPEAERPSGDRRMARLLLSALQAAGHQAWTATSLRMYEPAGDPLRQLALQRQAQGAADRILQDLAAQPSRRPQAWLTYHAYHKAPDVIGPIVATALDLPYLIVEPSVAAKRRGGAWAHGYALAASAIRRADLLFCLTRHDMAGVAALAGSEKLRLLPPFLDAAPFAEAAGRREELRTRLAERHGLDRGAAWILAVGMFRPGDKLESYRRLGAALALLDRDPPWQVLVVGDGSAATEVHAALAGLAGPVAWLGRLPEDALPEVYAACDLYAWPAANEAFGMAMLEAGAAGLPVVSCDMRGVPDVVRDRVTGLLLPEGDLSAFAAAIAGLIGDPDLRRRMGRAASAFVSGERSIAAAAGLLDEGLRAAVENRRRCRQPVSEPPSC